MDDSNVVGKLHGIDDAESVAVEGKRDLKNARAKAVHRLSNVRFATVRSDGKRGEKRRLCVFGKALEFPSAPP